MPTTTVSKKVFISFPRGSLASEAESRFIFRKIFSHLESLNNYVQNIELLYDENIDIGGIWAAQLDDFIMAADMAILLVNTEFLNSEIIKKIELPALMDRYEREELKIIPIAVEPCNLRGISVKYPHHAAGPQQKPLEEIQFANELRRPLSTLSTSEQDQKLAEISRKIVEFFNPNDQAEGNRSSNRSKKASSHDVKVEKKKSAVLVVGSGLIEDNLLSDKPVKLNYKHVVERERYYGGSGVNFSSRLIMTDHVVLPIMSIGRDDNGQEIQNYISDMLKMRNGESSAMNFVNSPDFRCNGMEKTSLTSIVIHGDQRTPFTVKNADVEKFGDFLDARLSEAEKIGDLDIRGVMIGHIYFDAFESNPGRCLTQEIINKFEGRAPILVNFGISQIEYGADCWLETLKKVDVVQFTLQEADHFFSKMEQKMSLEDILRWFKKNKITAIITHDKFGAVGVVKDDPYDRVIIARSLLIQNLVDKTGAGDAFASGLMAEMVSQNDRDFFFFQRAIHQARIWGAYACTKIGGSNESPTLEQLKEFSNSTEFLNMRKNMGVHAKEFDDPCLQDRLESIDLRYRHSY